MRTIAHYRQYEYVCPECKKRLPPIDRDGKEFVFRKCTRNKRHEKGVSVQMKLTKLERMKGFEFKVKSPY